MDVIELQDFPQHAGKDAGPCLDPFRVRHLVFLAADESRDAEIELTYNWDPEEYSGGRNFGHLAFGVDNIYDACQKLMDGGVIINRPPRDGRMAFVRSPDGISVELLQKGDALEPEEPWASMESTGEW